MIWEGLWYLLGALGQLLGFVVGLVLFCLWIALGEMRGVVKDTRWRRFIRQFDWTIRVIGIVGLFTMIYFIVE